nr:hypothetical protein [Tanacetum cinerariifolium]
MKENKNSVSENGNNIIEDKSSKSRITSNKSGNDTDVDGADNIPIYDTDSLEHVHNDDYNVLAMVKEHPNEIDESKRMNKSLDSSNMILDASNKALRTELERYKDMKGQKFSPDKTSAVYMKTTPPRFGLTRKPTGENVYGSPSEKVEGHGDWDALECTNTAGSKEKKVTKALRFNKIETKEEDDVEPEVILGRSFMRLVNGIVDFGSEVIIVYPEQGPFEDDYEKTEKSKDDRDRLLDFNFDDIPQLDGEELSPFVCKIRKSGRNKKRAIENLNLFYPDIRPSLSTGRHLTEEEEVKKALARRISQKFALLEEDKVELDEMIVEEEEKAMNKVKGEALKEKDDHEAFIFPIRYEGKINKNALADTRSDVLRTAESDSDDDEEYEIKRNKFGAPIYGPKSAAYLNCNDRSERSLALKAVINPFRKISVRKKSTIGGNDDGAGSLRSKRFRQYETIEECDGKIDEMLRIKLREAGSNEEISTPMAWNRAFNINEPIYLELCHEFYSTYEFDEVCVDDELKTKKIIKFRLGGHAHNLTFLEFARRVRLYHADELDVEGFDMYLEGGLRSDEHFNAKEYWLSISREENLSLSRSQASTIWSLVLRKNDLWLLSMFDARHQNQYANVAWLIERKARVLSDGVLRSLSARIYYRCLDTTTLRELINFEGRLILEDPQPGVSRVAIPRPPRASMQDLYEMMGSMEIRHGAIEWMAYRQSYHWDRYAGVFEHMAGVYSVPLYGAYNPPRYAQSQYDLYYQQYPPRPPQYQQ